MERIQKILDAACAGTVLVEESDIPENFSSLEWLPDNPLHLASAFGNLQFADDFLNKVRHRFPESVDSQIKQSNKEGYTPLHLASANGHLEMVRFLLRLKNDLVEEICLSKGGIGKNALHCAVINGKIDVIALLLSYCSKAVLVPTSDNETVLLLALEHNHLEAFRFLIQRFRFGPDLLNLRDDFLGNTVLHLAAEKADIQIIKKLLEQEVDINITDKSGCTTLDLIAMPPTNLNDEYIVKLIRSAGGITSRNVPSKRFIETINEMRTGVLVMASLIATVSFQVALTAPGGFWQDWGSTNTTQPSVSHVPGNSILFDLPQSKPDFSRIIGYNIISFMSSIASIVMLLLPSKDILIGSGRPFAIILNLLIGIALYSTTVEFLVITAVTTGGHWGLRTGGILYMILGALMICSGVFMTMRRRKGRV